MKQLLGNGCSSQCQDHWGSPRLNRGPAHLCPLHQVPSFPPPGMHTLKTGTTSVWELSKTEESLGLVPSQVSTVTTRPGATWRGVGGRVSAGQRGTPGLLPPTPHSGPQAHLHFLTAQAQLAASLLKEGHSSPCGHGESWGCCCLPRMPSGPGRAWGHIGRGGQTPKWAAASST